MFAIHDWRVCRPDAIAAVLDMEADRWRSDFAWDVTDAWRSIDPARVAGTLPGFVAVDEAGRIVGWTCFLLHHGALQVAVFAADAGDVTNALLDAIFASPDAMRAVVHAVCVRDAAPALRPALARRGFETTTYRYLAAGPDSLNATPRDGVDAFGSPGDHGSHPRAWCLDDLQPLIQLYARAYADRRAVRAFAPLGTDREWHDYVMGLIAGPGCGRFLPTASVVIDGREPGRLDGGLIATDLGHGTAHIAQVAVDPDAQGRGLGAALVGTALHLLAEERFDRVTLLVSSANRRAARLYARLGFADRASFVVAVNRQPRRLSRLAFATGGVRTRR